MESKKLFLALFILTLAGSATFASDSIDPLAIGVGARSLAMGKTGIVSPGDINALFVNPANAAYLDHWAATSMYTSLMQGEINYTLLGAGSKTAWGGFGVAYLSGASGGIAVTTRDAFGRVIPAGTSFDYASSVVALSWGNVLRENLAGGAILKYVSKGFSSYSTGSGFDLDLGIEYRISDKLRVGLALQNILPNGISWGSGTSEDLPASVRYGLNCQARENVAVNAEMDLSRQTFHTGAEWQVSPVFSLRGGFDQVAAGAGTVFNPGLGMGLNFKGVTFDYAYYSDQVLAGNLAHYFTLGFTSNTL